MRLTKDALRGALKTANYLYNQACGNDDKPEIARWASERSRILALLNTYDKENNNGC